MAAALILGFTASTVIGAEEPARADAPSQTADFAGPMWEMEALSKAPAMSSAEPFRSEGLKAIFFEGVPFQGKPTRVFAWLGLPKVQPGEKAPGIVLIHGGGGTAFEGWTRLWTERGYAAIAIDTGGSLPIRTANPKAWEHNDAGGPPGWGGYDQIDQPRTDQWAYHAVADAILAHSLLRSQPGVDPDRIGVTGISWGGYLTSIIAGVDPRFRFAIPVYGCGFTDEHGFAESVKGLGPERASRWMRWWDPSAYLGSATLPMLWVTGTNDFAYTLNALQKSYQLPKGPQTLCIRPRMPHGHEAGWAPEEILMFAESIVGKGAPLAKITQQGAENGSAWIRFESATPIQKAELHFTKDLGKWQERQWEMLPAEMTSDGKASAALPEGTRVYFFNLTDERGAVVSSAHAELAE